MGEGKTIIVTVSWKLLNEAAVKEIFICFDSRVHGWLLLDFKNAKCQGDLVALLLSICCNLCVGMVQ